MTAFRLRLLLPAVLVVAGACQTPRVLRMEPREPAWTEAARAAEGSVPRGIRSVVVTATLEEGREDFIGRAEALVGALAVRGVGAEVVETGAAGAASLDVEPALRAARASGADAVLEVRTWAWRPSDAFEEGRRYFVEVAGRDTLGEVDRSGYERARGQGVRYWYGNRVLDFRARLLDPADGREVAAIEVRVPRVNVADPLVVLFDPEGEILSESYSWANDRSLDALLAGRAVEVLFGRVAERVAGG